MGGYRGSTEREATVIVRLTTEEKLAWEAYIKEAGGYLSVLVRRAVRDYMVLHPRPKAALWSDRW